MPLNMVKPGDEVTLMAIHAGLGLQSRLHSMGLFPGVKMKVLKSGPGPVIVSVGDTRLALGCGMAHKIMVR
ncbi:MAG: FeoA family protein [Thermodesulfobacteriota bacterium]